jgi:hypothetical protein
MSLSKELIERFQAVYAHKNGEVIGYSAAETQLKEIAELIRLTASESQESQDA